MSSVETQPEYVNGAFLEEDLIEDREYQSTLVHAAQTESSLVALPTGTGKTPVAIRIAASRLDNPGGKVLMLAPTQPLVQQHAESFNEMTTIPEHEIKVFTGDTPPDERQELWNGATSIVLATPQVIENDLVGNRYDLSDVSYLVFDECHRATGDYAYNYISERYHGNADNPLVTGLSASPGSDKDSILTVCKNLGLTNVEVITEEDEELKKYLNETEVSYKYVDMPDEILESRDIIQDVFQEKLKVMKSEGVMNSAAKDVSFRQLQAARGDIQKLINNGESKGYEMASVHAEAVKLYHALKTIETQTPEAASEYFEGIQRDANSSDGTKAAQSLMSNEGVKEAWELLESYAGIHPKLTQLAMESQDILDNDGKVLVFTEYRSTAASIVEFLNQNPDVKATRFVGQQDKDNDPGMSQTEQKETVEEFRNGEYNVLVATSVAEEGLDIPAVDLVMMFEPVPSGIRTIQRRGRTGRESDGKVIVLIANDTRDEQKYWIAKNREKSMKEDLNSLKEIEGELNKELQDEQRSLADFGERFADSDSPVVVVDSRETQSNITKTLDRNANVQVQLETLAVADYVCSDRVAVERKEHQDFLDTLQGKGDRDLFDQIGDLANSYSRPILILESNDETTDVDDEGSVPSGIEGLYARTQMSRDAIEGALASIAVDYGVTVMHTAGESGTASLVARLARREQEESNRSVSMHGSKSANSLSDEQKYVVSSIASVGPVLAENLLEHFGSVKAVLTAPVEELQDVEKVGQATAEKIREIIDSSYDE